MNDLTVLTSAPQPEKTSQLRIGGANYLNSWPLTRYLRDWFPDAEINFDVPSQLAEDLAAGKLDVALIPSIEFFRIPGANVVSDACVACQGEVRSVKLLSRVQPNKIRTLALDQTSRSSVVLGQLWLRERWQCWPQTVPLSADFPLGSSACDAAILIGDRAMQTEGNWDGFTLVYDLGSEWYSWTGLPFVFALWVCRPGIDANQLHQGFAAARDEGIRKIPQLSREASERLGIREEVCCTYLAEKLRFHFDEAAQAGLERFRQLAVKHHLLRPR